MKIPKQCEKSVQSQSIFIDSIEQISFILQVFPLLTINKQMPAGKNALRPYNVY